MRMLSSWDLSKALMSWGIPGKDINCNEEPEMHHSITHFERVRVTVQDCKRVSLLLLSICWTLSGRLLWLQQQVLAKNTTFVPLPSPAHTQMVKEEQLAY